MAAVLGARVYNWSIGRITPLLALLIAVDAHLLVTYAGLPGQLLETFPLMYHNMHAQHSHATSCASPYSEDFTSLAAHVISALPRNMPNK